MAFFQSSHLWINEPADGVAALVLDSPASKVNLLTDAFVTDIERAIEQVADSGRFHVLIVQSGKSNGFCGGIDPHWRAALGPPDAHAALAGRGQRLCERLAGLPIPTVAVVSGACLGAGLELALACDYRVVIDRPTTVLGLPQVELGLIPAWGGTQRLPRVVGLERGFLMLLSGRRVNAREALAWGLADTLAEENDATPPDFLADPVKRDWTRFRRRTLRQHAIEGNPLGRWLALRGAERVLRQRLPDGLPAPAEALQALRIAVQNDDLAPGLDFERDAVARLAASPAHQNLLHLQLERERRRGALPEVATAERVQHVGIIGTDDRALALLHQCVTRGCEAVVHAPDRDALGLAVLKIYGLFRDELNRGVITEAAQKRFLGAVRGTVAYQFFDQADLVLDVTEEDADSKRQRLRQLEAATRPTALIVCATPALTVSEVQQELKHPERVAGLHPHQPGQRGGLAEVARGAGTSDDAVRRVTAWAGSLGQTPVAVADVPGRLVARVLAPAFNEAGLLLREGLSPDRIDEALTRFGMAQGPLEQADAIGLDALALLIDELQPVFEGRLLLETGWHGLVEQGWLGTRSHAGFYRYQRGKRTVHEPALRHWRAASRGEPPAVLPVLSPADTRALVQRRVVALMVLEAARCLEEEIVPDAATLDFALCVAGWAPHRGGPLTYARRRGRGPVLAELAELAGRYGPRFAAVPALDTIF
jgi:3-hydroxyacyl-CoA dehydrogenase/enoyl-CoA hydratase/3-hydroxybutyryl-CoA epimerase